MLDKDFFAYNYGVSLSSGNCVHKSIVIHKVLMLMLMWELVVCSLHVTKDL